MILRASQDSGRPLFVFDLWSCVSWLLRWSFGQGVGILAQEIERGGFFR